MNPIIRGLTRNTAETDPHGADKHLVGRTYAIPFDAVWSESLALANGGIRGWSITSSNDQSGTILATSTTLVFRFVDDVRVHIGLDGNAQTRVSLRSASRKGTGDLGRNRRTIGNFLRRLDKRLDARPEQILDPAQAASRHS